MKNSKYLSNEEVNGLLVKVKSGDNEAWEKLYTNFEAYVHSRAQHLLRECEPEKRNRYEEDMFQAGWSGFIDALKNYKEGKTKFITYATRYIDGEMYKERDRLFNTLGLKDKPKYQKAESIEKAKEAADERLNLKIAKVLSRNEHDDAIDAVAVSEKYPAEGRTVQILELLRMLTDENHTLSKEEIKGLLRGYRAAKYKKIFPMESNNTITSTMEELITELDPLEYTGDNDSEYKILYDGYKENRFKENKARSEKKANATEAVKGKAKTISNFSYNHVFSKNELDLLIEQVCFSAVISEEEKEKLVQKLISTASLYYKSPFWDGQKLKFNPKAVHGRFDARNGQDRTTFLKNLAVLQEALNNLGQIRFRFNGYTAEGNLESGSEYFHELSPYHLVVYQDHFYCIGLKKNDKRIWHYRVDLMSDIEIVRNDAGKIIPIELGKFDGLPISNATWDPEQYMSEHLYMAYDEPRDIHIKIKNTNYTILHDWFGAHYEKTNQATEEGYDIVKVRTSPNMIIHWAMQYAGAVEIMDEDIREKIREEIDSIGRKYKKTITS